MAHQTHHLMSPPDAAVCTTLFTYTAVVFFLAVLSIDELGTKVRRSGRLPPGSFLYLTCILLWPITAAIPACLLLLGLLHTGLGKAYALSARGVEACRRGMASCFPKREREVDLEMTPLVPVWPGSVSRDDSGADYGCSQAKMASRAVVLALKKECGLTAERWYTSRGW